MPWPKIHRRGLFVTTIDRRPVGRGQSGWIVLHSATTFDLPSVHAVPTALRLFVGVTHCAIPCGRCVSRSHLFSLTQVASIVCLHP
ncbi:hypothetical protein TNCT_419781 [Trichonephila clavata]|uniref:Uncharacterized protein n=1 Tax=Trichonephila clavata TaxID=2740835 RepID=A0A8X6LGN6_TRICU|nr:hypothetical protein TNCT_419781 [Trichonephila clavata]